jgi:signal transduction histidine kinase
VWAKKTFVPLRVRSGPVCALESDGTALVSTGNTPGAPPDFILPVRSVFGAWELAAWDPVMLRTSYDFRILAVGGFLSLLIVVLGVLAYLQQKRLLAQTAQQVTFVNRVSHELRSPLTNILLNLELSQEMLGEQAQAPARRLALVQEEALRLRRLVDNVLAFSALDREKYRWEKRPCVPDDLVQAVIAQFAAAFVRRGLLVRFAGGAGVACALDADAVAQVLANLLSNIEKYVPPGTVDIATNLGGNELTVTVHDEGTGVPAAESERIFRPFERLDGRINEGSSGTGLGLSIARELAVGMGGSLRLVPSRTGAIFELRVPAYPAMEAGS